MLLIGMLDSPYVRRVAVSLSYMGFDFERKNLSVFRNMPEFSTYNPVIKAPTFVTDDGVVLMDSTLIIQYFEANAKKIRSLLPKDNTALALDIRVTGLALAATDKAIQIEYEEKRPLNERSPSWLERITEQMLTAFTLLEKEYQNVTTPWLHGDEIMQGDIATIIAFHFIKQIKPDFMAQQHYPILERYWQQGEDLDFFKKYPHS